MTKEEILALAKFDNWAGRKNAYVEGRLFENQRLVPLIQALVESREELRQALHSIASWNEGEEVSVRFDELDLQARHSQTTMRAWLVWGRDDSSFIQR